MKNDIKDELPIEGGLSEELNDSTLPRPADAESASDKGNVLCGSASDATGNDRDDGADEDSDGAANTDDSLAPDDGELDWQPTGIEYSELDYSDMNKDDHSEQEGDDKDDGAPECDGNETDVEDEVGEEAAGDIAEESGDETTAEEADEQIGNEEADDEEDATEDAEADDADESDDIGNDDDEDNEIGDELPAPREAAERPRRERPRREIGSRRIDALFDFLELFIFTFVAVLIATSFLFRHSVVSGDSMMNTLQDADKLIISDLFYEPSYMDIVVVQDYSAGIDEPIVKRVIATEGQLVRVAPEGIYVDGEFLDEDGYVYIDVPNIYYYSIDPSAFTDNDTLRIAPGRYYEFTVPEDEVFILGDHRNDSRDSRYYGTVREDAILGRVMLRFYPFDSFTFFERGGDDNGN